LQTIENTRTPPTRPPVQARPRSANTRPYLIWAFVTFGVVCCIAQYAARISFWHDEAYQVLNVMEQSYGEVTSTLGRNQTAPPLFMVGIKACGQWLGHNEYSLRLIPVLAGVLAIIAFAAAARRMLPLSGAILAAGMIALSPTLIEHATEVKQYSGDVLAAALILWAGARAFSWKLCPGSGEDQGSASSLTLGQTSLRLLGLALLAAVLFWYSEVQLFVFAGTSLALLPRFARQKGRGWLAYLACHIPILISAALLYLVSIQWQRSTELLDFWIDHGGLPDYARWWMLPLWLANGIRQLFNYFCNPIGPATLVLGIIGVIALWRRRERGSREVLAVLLLPMLLTLLAALAHRYPFGGSRATLFLIPSVALLTAAGFTELTRKGPRLKTFAIGAAAVLLVSGAAQAGYHLIVPRNQSHPRPAIEYVQQHRTPDQGVWVPHGSSWIEFQCYWPQRDSLIWGPNEKARLQKVKEFWLVFEFDPRQGMKKRKPLLDEAAKTADQVEEKLYNGGAAYRFRVRD
jgi:uncharacterized membrane protein